jgi:tRNA nucleotidyltransferase/poly(A) polymerase
MTDSFKLAEHLKVMHTLENKGFEAFLVGGCVRDRLLGRQSKDYDVTTDATPDQVRAIFPKTVPVGAKFGVVVVVMDGVQIEVATYRADGAYTDGRRPDEVTYSKTAKDDVVRRDFTMNGLLKTALGDVIDYVGGQEDIKNKIIRAIGNPDARFAEDALRMMRAVRFAAQLGFTIEEKTLEAIKGNARLLAVISRERIAMELFRMLSAPEPLKGIVPFITTGLYRFALPQSFAEHTDGTRNIQRFGMFKANKDAMLGMAMLFADVCDHYCEGLANYLKLSNVQCDELVYMKHHVTRFRQHLTGAYRMTEAAIKRELRKPGVELALEIMTQDEVMGKTNFGVEALMTFVLKIKAYTPEQIKPMPLVTGKDLIDAGIPPGPIFTEILFDVESHQLNDVWTTKEEAMKFVIERVYQDTLKEWVYMGLSTAEVRELE